MTTCHGCNRPLESLAAIRIYHSGCDPQGRVEMLERRLAGLIGAAMTYRVHHSLPHGSPREDKDGADRHLSEALNKAGAALEYRPAQMKGREG
jgi:hypothetical protein